MALRTSRTDILTYEAGRIRPRRDTLATEEPLEIRLAAGGERRSVALTMRTPGADFELAAGFLFSEGVIGCASDIVQMRYCVDPQVDDAQRYNIVTVELRRPRLPDLAPLERHFSAGSACGVCGKTSIDALSARGCAPLPVGAPVDAGVLPGLPPALRADQSMFAQTGGLHAVGLFDHAGHMLAVREDVGRHNAMDKLIGWAVLGGRVPLERSIAILSGRASYELVQKAITAGIPMVGAVSAPSSLAVQLARAFGVTLVGFLRGERYNIYSWPERLVAHP